MATRGSIQLRPHDRVRVGVGVAGSSADWIVIDELFNMHIAGHTGNHSIFYTFYEAWHFQPAYRNVVTKDNTDLEPRMAIWHHSQIVLLFTRMQVKTDDPTDPDKPRDVFRIVSHSDGRTFGPETKMFDSGKHPTIATGRAYEILYAAYVDGAIQAVHQEYDGGKPGLDTDDNPLPTYNFQDSNGVDLEVEDDTFHFQASATPGAPWIMIVRIKDEATASFWRSTGHPPTTWVRFA